MLNKLGNISVFAILVIALIKCDNYEFPESPYPRIETLPIVNVSEAGVTFEANILKLGKTPIINHGFAWGLQENFAINNLDKVNLGPIADVGLFEASVKYGLYADTTYYVRSFVQTETYFVYGKTLSFKSQGSTPPAISRFTPAEGTWGDTIKISGAYFSTLPTDNHVQFASVDAKVISSTDSTIFCVIPEGIVASSVPVTISVSGNASTSLVGFKLTSPHIEYFSPAEGTFGDVVVITGSHFSPVKERNTVMFNDKIAEVIDASKSTITVKVPARVISRENEISVMLNGQSTTAGGAFKVLPPSITSISAHEGYVLTTIEIAGNNFNPTPQGNILLFGKNPVRILTASKQLLTIEIPDGNFRERTNLFELTVAEQIAVSVEAFTVKDAWIRKADTPPTDWSVTTFAIGEKGYVVSGDQTWRYNPEDNTWDHVAVFPGEKRLDPLGFVINKMGYVGMGYDMSSNALNDFWRFDPVTSKWSRLADFLLGDLSGVALSAGGKGYVATGFVTIGLWEYDPLYDSWGKRGGDLDAQFAGYPHRADAGFSLDDRLFVYLTDETSAPNPLFEFDLITDNWISRGQPEANDHLQNRYTTGFSVKGNGYIRGLKNLYVYDVPSNSWQVRAADRLGDLHFAKSFVVNDKAYVVGAYLGTRYSLWEYDPAYDLP